VRIPADEDHRLNRDELLALVVSPGDEEPKSH
jgi:hypothetical protein